MRRLKRKTPIWRICLGLIVALVAVPFWLATILTLLDKDERWRLTDPYRHPVGRTRAVH